MTRKAKEKEVKLVKETEQVLVFKAKRPMRETEFKLLSELVRHEEEKAGVKIVLVPYSADLVEVKEVEQDKKEANTPELTLETNEGNKEQAADQDDKDKE